MGNIKDFEKPWMDNFITMEAVYIAWDETQSDELGRFSTRKEAIKCLINHAEYLDKESSHALRS